jgi:hypothetical protein
MKIAEGPRVLDAELPEDFRLVNTPIEGDLFGLQLQRWIEYRVRLTWWSFRRVTVKGWRPVQQAPSTQLGALERLAWTMTGEAP